MSAEVLASAVMRTLCLDTEGSIERIATEREGADSSESSSSAQGVVRRWLTCRTARVRASSLAFGLPDALARLVGVPRRASTACSVEAMRALSAATSASW